MDSFSSRSTTPPPEYEMTSNRVNLSTSTRQNPCGNTKTVEMSRAKFVIWRYSKSILWGMSAVIFLLILGILIHHFVAHFEGSIRTTPKFYEEKNYTGGFYTPHPSWEKKECIDLPGWINDRSMSIETGSHCLEIYEETNCTIGQGKSHQQIFKGSYSHDDLDKIQMGKKISSFKLCPSR